MAHCSQYPAINRYYLSDQYLSGTRTLYHRTGYNSSGVSVHGIKHSSSNYEHFNSTFYAQCGHWINYYNFSMWVYANLSTSWVGEAGVGYCKSGYHGSARAFDLTHVRYSNGAYVDTNWSWRQSSLTHRRRYVGVAASCRYWFGTVLTAWYNADHQNHIHFDNGVSVPPIRTSARSDAILVQAACNFLNGESLAIDGAWGSLTEAAYNRLLSDFRMTCYSPKTNLSHARAFLDMITIHGIGNHSAGYYHLSC